MNYWEIIDQSDYIIIIQDPEGWYRAFIKWDGCIDFNRIFNLPLKPEYENDPKQEINYLHICDINDLINRLEALKEIAKKHFKTTNLSYQYWDDA